MVKTVRGLCMYAPVALLLRTMSVHKVQSADKVDRAFEERVESRALEHAVLKQRKVYELKQAHDILVVGGGKLLTSLIKAELLDCLTLYTVPVMVGKGIGFIGETFGSQWKLSESGVLDGGVVRSTYLFGKTAIE